MMGWRLGELSSKDVRSTVPVDLKYMISYPSSITKLVHSKKLLPLTL
jgi:hypothetical protein